jgi:hypothetical protein
MISKQPRDLFRLEPLRKFYSVRPANLKIILMQRDPRDLLTAQRKRGNSMEYVGVAKNWKGYYSYFLQQRDASDVLLVRYEDLVSSVAGEQKRIEAFVEQTMAVPFEGFVTVERPDFDMITLNGLRPLDASRIARWQECCHTERMRQMLKELPDLPDAVQELGYETNSDWVTAYQ